MSDISDKIFIFLLLAITLALSYVTFKRVYNDGYDAGRAKGQDEIVEMLIPCINNSSNSNDAYNCLRLKIVETRHSK